MDNPSVYVYDLFNTSLPIDYTEQGDRWIQFLEEALREEIPGINGHGLGSTKPTSAIPYPHWNYRVNVNPNVNANIIPELNIVPVGDKSSKGVYLFLSSKQHIIQKDIDVWIKSIEKARHRLNEDNPVFQWTAVLCHGHDLRSRKFVLRKEVHLDSITIKSAKNIFTMYEKGAMPNFGSFSISQSWPIVLKGEAKGYNWFVASQVAGQQIHKIAALLSLAWSTTWKLVQSPQELKAGEIKIPESNMPIPHKINGGKQKKFYKVLPKWIITAFYKIDSESTLKHALNVYYQGLIMEEEHPSFALIAFVASIESVGRIIIGKNCSCCGKQNTDNRIFKAGLSSVITSTNEVKRLSNIYGERSDTVHNGVLHGNETSLGAINLPSMFNITNADLFAYTDLHKIKDVARNSIIKAIKRLR